MLDALRKWLQLRKRRGASDVIEVECDDVGFRVIRQHAAVPEAHSFDWRDVRRVCFRDMGMAHSDLLYFEVAGHASPVTVPTEATGGDVLWNMVQERGLFPPGVATAAIRSTDGGLYCWPHE